MSRYLHCTVCEKGIEVHHDDQFNYTVDALGPYCDRCWKWQEQIEALRARVTDLEEDIQTRQRKTYSSRPSPSPYDASRKRT
jgi:hypothetical protein